MGQKKTNIADFILGVPNLAIIKLVKKDCRRLGFTISSDMCRLIFRCVETTGWYIKVIVKDAKKTAYNIEMFRWNIEDYVVSSLPIDSISTGDTETGFSSAIVDYWACWPVRS